MARRVTRVSRGIRLPKAEQIPYEPSPSVRDRVVGGVPYFSSDVGIMREPTGDDAYVFRWYRGAPPDPIIDERGGLPMAPFVEDEPIFPSWRDLVELWQRPRRRAPDAGPI